MCRTGVNCSANCINGGKWEFNSSSCSLPGSQFFNSRGNFAVPPGITSVRVLLVGGFVMFGTVNLTVGATFPVVGGGAGS